MAHLSGVFAHPFAGRLRVTFSGTFYEGTARDSGFPSGGRNILLGATVNGNKIPPIDRNAPCTYAELNYPGGGATWSLSTNVIATTGSGVANYGFKDLQIILQLIKK